MATEDRTIDFDYEVRVNGRRTIEVLFDIQALELTGKTCAELFQGWTGTARISDQLAPEVQNLARNYLKELRYQASIAELIETGQLVDGEATGDREEAPMLAPIRTVGGVVLATSSYPKGIMAQARETSPDFGKETINGCGC